MRMFPLLLIYIGTFYVCKYRNIHTHTHTHTYIYIYIGHLKCKLRIFLLNINLELFCISIHKKKVMAPHSSTLAWKSCLENPMDGGAWCTAVRGVANSRTRLSDFTFTFTFMHWRRKWQPTPVFLPGESQGQGSLVGCRLWGCTESDMTEAT